MRKLLFSYHGMCLFGYLPRLPAPPPRLDPPPLFWACIAGAFGLAFGRLCIPGHIVFHGVPGAIGWWIAGIPMDLIHAAATVIFILIAAEPMLEKLDRIKVKYGLVE